MGHHIRRRVASIQLGFAAGALGLLAGIGLGRGSEPPTVDAEPAAKKTITITGSNIVDGSVKYKDLNKASIQKGIYLKTQTDKLFLKLTEADTRFHKLITNALGGYVKLGDADTRYLKLDALNGYLKLTDADTRFLKLDALDSYIKIETADARFLKLDALNGYLKLDAADARFAKLDDLGAYVKLDALNGYLKLDALDGYLKLDAADDRFLKLDDVDSVMEKHLANFKWMKIQDAEDRFVEGDGSVLTGSQTALAEHQTLVTLPKTMAMDDWDDQQGRGVNIQLKNLSEGVLDYASTAPDPAGGGTFHGSIDQGGSSTAILIGLLQPTTLQVVNRADGSVHTLVIVAYDRGAGKTQVTAQALSGAPPVAR